MKTYKNLYHKIYGLKNLILAWRKARKHKTKKDYVIEFEKNLGENLRQLKFELMSQTYKPKPLQTFILRDPKTRKISKSDFRDGVVHHALYNIIEPIFDKTFIYDSCANRKGKGTLFALERFESFQRKATNNFSSQAYCLKADIKHYFQEVNHEILLNIIKRKIADKQVIWLMKEILNNCDSSVKLEERERERERCEQIQINRKGMPLGNLTSQFFANVYLNELDYFIKHILKVKYYIRYVDDFVILHSSKSQLEVWKKEIDKFLIERLKLELNPQKSKIISLSKGIDFVGFRNFYYFKLLRKRNIKNMENKIKFFNNGKLSYEKLLESFQGWQAYAKWADTHTLRKKLIHRILSLNFSIF